MATPFAQGEILRAEHFVNNASRTTGTPTADVDKVVKLESEGKIHQFFIRNHQRTSDVNAGETINGATLPVPVYQDTSDNELYACAATPYTKIKFLGFVVNNTSNGNSAELVSSGIVSGFTGLAEGEPYYVQNTSGTIGTAVGSTAILCGIAISQTQLVILKGKRYASGIDSFASSTTATKNIGFRPILVLIHAALNKSVGASGLASASWGCYNHQDAGNTCTWTFAEATQAGGGRQTSVAWYVKTAAGSQITGVVDTVTANGFRLNNTDDGAGQTAYVHWEAFGDL